MSQKPRVLLIDDGDLSRIWTMLEGFEIERERLRGRLVEDDLEGPYDVVIGTVKQILTFEDKFDLAQIPGKPAWIAVHSQDFLPLRVRLRKMNVGYLVQSSVGSEALRLLIHHTLYRGPAGRDSRLPIGITLTCVEQDGSSTRAELLDLSEQGARLLRATALPSGAPVTVELPARLAGGEKLGLPCRTVRTEPQSGGDRHFVSVRFEALDSAARHRVDDILQGKVIGTVVTRLGDELSEDTASTTIPASSTRPPSPEPEAPPQPTATSGSKTPRANRRVSYARQVTALVGGGAHAIMGRDLSIDGMRSDPVPELTVGTQLELALYGSSGAEPVLVRAEVARDEGLNGTVFRFELMNPADRPQLERIISSAPEVQALGGDAPVVVAEARPIK